MQVVSVTDDEATFILRLKLCLTKAGIPVSGFKGFSDSDSFIEAFMADKASGGHGIIFLDINIKGSKLDGFGILQELRQKLNGTPIIAIISTSSRKEEVERARSLRADCYIVKSGSLPLFSQRMIDFKADFVDQRIKEFKVYGAEEVS